MSSFTDLAGVTRGLSINLAHRRTIKQQTGWDLVAIAHQPAQLDGFLQALQTDDDLLWRIIAILTNTNAAELMAAADGTVYEDASEAFLQALQVFFPAQSPLRRPLGDLLQQLKTAQTEARSQVEARLLGIVNDIGSGISGFSGSMSGSGDLQHSPQATG